MHARYLREHTLSILFKYIAFTCQISILVYNLLWPFSFNESWFQIHCKGSLAVTMENVMPAILCLPVIIGSYLHTMNDLFLILNNLLRQRQKLKSRKKDGQDTLLSSEFPQRQRAVHPLNTTLFFHTFLTLE